MRKYVLRYPTAERAMAISGECQSGSASPETCMSNRAAATEMMIRADSPCRS